MKDQASGLVTLGIGAIYSKSTKQKLNTKSSAESKLVGIDNTMPQILWTRYFLEVQVFIVKDDITYKDNQSSIKLKKNERKSNGKRTRHVNM